MWNGCSKEKLKLTLVGEGGQGARNSGCRTVLGSSLLQRLNKAQNLGLLMRANKWREAIPGYTGCPVHGAQDSHVARYSEAAQIGHTADCGGRCSGCGQAPLILRAGTVQGTQSLGLLSWPQSLANLGGKTSEELAWVAVLLQK